MNPIGMAALFGAPASAANGDQSNTIRHPLIT
jgi:hypothetical protein